MGGELQETSKKVDIIRSYTMQLVATVQLVLAASPGYLGTWIRKNTLEGNSYKFLFIQVVLERLAELDKIET